MCFGIYVNEDSNCKPKLHIFLLQEDMRKPASATSLKNDIYIFIIYTFELKFIGWIDINWNGRNANLQFSSFRSISKHL